jgi:hypothetical protein
MFEDSFLDSFMESYIGGWTPETEHMYEQQEDAWESNDSDPDGDGDYDPDYDVWDEDECDGQPSEYTEWQDVYGGDDWDHGQYDGE